MSTHREEKLKKVLESVPAGFLVDSGWLTAHGVDRFLTRNYVKSGWLERLERGVFRRPAPNDTRRNTLDWRTSLLSVQHIMGYEVHVGGMSALALQGHSHYLSLGKKNTVWLYGHDIPPWLAKLPLDATLSTRSLSLFDDAALGLTKDEAETSASLPWDWQLKMSGPERAILEALDELPDHESFHNIDMVFQGLVNLRPRMLSKLLKSCRRIKVTRLFFVFADRHDHAWRKRLDPEEFEFGSGDRALVKGGKIHPRYRIMVPPEFIGTKKEGGDGA